MRTLVGTGRLARLILRRDRVRLPIWIAVLAVLPIGTARAFIDLYPTAAEREQLANTVASTPAMVAFLGPIHGSSIGSLTAWRVGTLGSVLVGLMAVLTVIRHTREEEESGRRELLGSTVVGRNALLLAALLVAGGAGLALGLIVTVGLIGTGLSATGSLAFGLGYLAVALVFAAVASVAAQLTEGSGAARGIAISVVGASFLLRVAGDGGEASGLGWLSWLSPIGWFTRLRPFAGEHWWVLALSVGLAVPLVLVAVALSSVRDAGAGVFAARPGPARAAPALSTPLGLAWRLERGALLAWTLGLATFGVVFGSLANGVGDLLKDNPQLAEIFEQLGGEAGITDAFFGVAMGILALIVTAYAMRATLRLRVEEESLRAELVLATATTRLRWVTSHLVFAVLGPMAILTVAGIVAGAIYGAVIGDPGGQIPRVAGASLIHTPAVWVLVGLTLAIYGWAPRLTSVSWGVLVGCLLLGQLGELLRFPQWALNLSPFSHVPDLPAVESVITPLLILTGVAAAWLVAGMIGFQRRDVTP